MVVMRSARSQALAKLATRARHMEHTLCEASSGRRAQVG